MKTCIVIPHFNQTDLFIEFLPALSKSGMHCIIVDDGSKPENVDRIEQALQTQSFEHTFIKHGYNRGKGAAVFTGASAARLSGFTHILQIDADGQHNINDIKAFFDMSEKFPEAIISGWPQFDETAPKARLYGRKVTDFWVSIETLSFKIKDSLCGFRVYPLTQLEQINDIYHIGKRMTFDTDVMVKSVWEGVDVKFIPTNVIYHEVSSSHFHYLRDNVRLIVLHARLMVGMLLRLPKLVFRKFSAKK